MVLFVAAIASGAIGSASRGLYRLVGLVGQITALVESNYVEEVPLDRLAGGAMSGLVGAADPEGAWVPEDVAAGYARLQERSVPPFGLVLAERSSYPLVIEVIPGSPADKAGLVPGELVERIDEQHARARPLWRSQLHLGDAERAGRNVAMDVINSELTGKTLVTVKPGAVPERVEPEVTMEKDTPVVRIPVADAHAVGALEKALAAHATAPAVVVDLRGSSLGTPEAAAKLAASIAGGHVELHRLDRGGHDQVVAADGPARTWSVYVCVDVTTARAAEVLALGLQQRGATLVGRETFGDTGERHAIRGAGGQLWLASRWFVDAEGKPLLAHGLKPAELVRGRVGTNAILERALELATSGHAEAKKAA